MLENIGPYFYIIFVAITAIGAYAIIPKQDLKKYFLYGLVFGAVGDILVYSTIHSLGLAGYLGFEELKVLNDYSIFTPITWLFAFMIFFYFLPVRPVFLIIYIAAWTALNYSVGLVMENLGLFWHAHIYYYFEPLVFAAWYSIAAFGFRKLEKRYRV